MKIRLQQIIKLERTVKSNCLGQAIFSKNWDSLQARLNRQGFLNIFSILTEGKTPVIKERLNKSATCSEISFFRINIYSISYINYLGKKP